MARDPSRNTHLSRLIKTRSSWVARLLARFAAVPDGRMHKLEAHQAARELGEEHRVFSVATWRE
jgi:hypothetical protein